MRLVALDFLAGTLAVLDGNILKASQGIASLAHSRSVLADPFFFCPKWTT